MKKMILLSIAVFYFGIVVAQKDSSEAKKLYNTIVSLDSLLFDAYNNCKLEQYASLLSEDFELFDVYVQLKV